MKQHAATLLPVLRRNMKRAGNRRGVEAVDAQVKDTAEQRPKRRHRMNKWEQEYAAYLRQCELDGRLLWWGYERITLKLADDCRYTPDFASVHADPGRRLMFAEVKGFRRDDALVKFRVAAEQYPWADFLMVEWTGCGWNVLMRYEAGVRVPAAASAVAPPPNTKGGE